MVEPILADVGDVEVGPAIIVVVRSDRADAPAIVCDACLLCDISKGAVPIIMEKRRVGRLAFTGQSGVGKTVYEIDVDPPVAIVVQQSDAAAERFDNEVFVGVANVVRPGSETGSPGGVFEDDRTAVDEAGGGDRWRRRVERGHRLGRAHAAGLAHTQ